MNSRALAAFVLAAASTAALASTPAPGRAPATLAGVAAWMESRYQGEVSAIAFDASGDKPAHYHVAMRFPESGLARVDVDAATLEIASHDADPPARGGVTLADAVALIAAQVPGDVLRAELDATAGGPPHFDVDVRLQHGATARLRVDAANGQVAWRQPAVVAD